MEGDFENVVEELTLSRYETRGHLAFCGPEFPPAFFATVLFPVGAFSFRNLVVGFFEYSVVGDITDTTPCRILLAPLFCVLCSLRS